MIDTVGKVGPYAMVDMYGTPHSEALHVVERYRLLDYAEAKPAMDRNDKENFRAGNEVTIRSQYKGKVLQLEFKVEDKNVFTMPWTSTITYQRHWGPWTDLICSENRREPQSESCRPTADPPDF